MLLLGPCRAPRPARRAVALAAALLGISACTGGGTAVEPLPPPPSTRPIPSTTTPANQALVQLPAVERGRTTSTTLALGPGKAKFEGRVVDPEGAPVGGSTIRVERLVEGAVAGIDVGSGADGAWELGGVMGGRYRVRAWRGPDLAMVNPVQVFLGASDKAPLELKLERFFGTVPKPAIAPNPPVVGQPASLAVQVSSRSVDDAGVVRAVPVAGAPAALVAEAGWAVQATNPTVTDTGGLVRWQVVCGAAGAQALRLVVAGEPFDLALPACAEPPPPPQPPAPGSTAPPTTARGGSTPSTTRPAASPTTTRPRSTP